MAADKITVYKRLLTAAYVYYMLIGAVWMVMSFLFGNYFNYSAFLVIAAFALQMYYKNRLVNLLLGIVLLFLSVFSVFDFLAMGGKSGFNGFVYTMTSLSLVSIIMSGILVFGYLKLSFADR